MEAQVAHVRGVAVFDRPELVDGGVQGQDVLRILGGKQVPVQGQPDDLRVDAQEVSAKHRVGRQPGIVLDHDAFLCVVIKPELDGTRLLARPRVIILRVVSGKDLLARLVLKVEIVVDVEVGHATIARLADKGLDDAVAGHVVAAGHAVVDHGNGRVVRHEHGAHAPNARHQKVGGGGRVVGGLDLGLVRKSGRHDSWMRSGLLCKHWHVI